MNELDGLFVDGEDLGNLVASLKSGGPPVNAVLVARFAAGVLAPAENTKLRELVSTYRDWFTEYWELKILSDSGHEVRNTTDEPMPDFIKSLFEDSTAFPASLGDKVDEFCDMTEDELSDCFADAGTRGDGTPLNPYIVRLAQLIRDDWNWPQRRSQPEMKSEKAQARSLFEFLRSAEIELPYPRDLVAVALVKLGLDRLCGLDDPT